jgi:thioredoxin reductase (NADPH)
MKLIFDVVILGVGPVSLQAAIHASRRKVEVLLLGNPIQSSLQRAWVENFCCLQNSSTGSDLLQHGRKQAEKFGAEILAS